MISATQEVLLLSAGGLLERSYATPVNSALVGPFGEHTDPVQVAVFELHVVLVEPCVHGGCDSWGHPAGREPSRPQPSAS